MNAGQPVIRSRVLALVFIELAGAAHMKQRLGDERAAAVLARHREMLRDLLKQTGGRRILEQEDSTFCTFESPSKAVEFALRMQMLHAENRDLPPMRAGIHTGEVTERVGDEESDDSIDVSGFAVDLASRLAATALPGQILTSYVTFDNARQRLTPDQFGPPVAWRTHGRYQFKGAERAVALFEVGIDGIAPLLPPPSSSTGLRESDQKPQGQTSWRPSPGQEIPKRTNWVVHEQLGEGSYGEVWIAEHQGTHERRAFKFCFSILHREGLKREVTVFRLLREMLGPREDLPLIIDWRLDLAPYYIEMEYHGERSLPVWAEEQGGLQAIPLGDRIDVVRQVASAVAAAHSVGVLHKDIKPANVLVRRTSDDQVRIRMIDYGIGAITDLALLQTLGITVSGQLEAEVTGTASGLEGTHLYLAPERYEGGSVTTQSDIYSLGVLLFQMVTGDLSKGIAEGWWRSIDDPLLRADIAECVEGDPARRLRSAGELADRLQHLNARREQARAEAEARHQQEEVRLESERSRKRRRQFALGMSLSLLTIALALAFALQQRTIAFREADLREEADSSRQDALKQRNEANSARIAAQILKEQADAATAASIRAQYLSSIGYIQFALSDHRLDKARDLLLTTPDDQRDWEWGYLLGKTAEYEFSLRSTDWFHTEFSRDGQTIVGAGLQARAGFVDFRTAEIVRSFDLETTAAWTIALSPDGKRLGAAGARGTPATVYDVETGRLVYRLSGHTGPVRAIAFDPSSRYIATGGRDDTARLWDSATGELLATMATPAGVCYAVDFSPDGRLLATASLGGGSMLWEIPSATLLHSFPLLPDNVLSIRFNPQGTIVVVACADGSVRQYGVQPGDELTSVSLAPTWPNAVDVSPSDPLIAVGCEDGRVLLLDSGSLETRVSVLSDAPVWKVRFSPNGRHLLVTARRTVRCLNVQELLQRNQPLRYRDIEELGRPLNYARVRGYSLMRDVAWRERDLHWDAGTGRTAGRSGGINFVVDSQWAAFTPDGRAVVRFDAARNYRPEVIETSSGRTLARPATGQLANAVISPDGRFAALGETTSTVWFYDTADWSVAGEFRIPEGNNLPIHDLTFNDAGTLLAVCTNMHPVYVVEVPSGRVAAECSQPHVGAYSAAFSKDDALLAVGYEDDRIRIFDLETREVVTTCMGHTRRVTTVVFRDDSRRLLSVSGDNTVKLWDVESGFEVLTLAELPRRETVLTAGFTHRADTIFYVTSLGAVVTERALPWITDGYPGGPAMPFPNRLELLKRSERPRSSAAAGRTRAPRSAQ